MAISVPPSSLTAANRASYQQQFTSRATGLNATARARKATEAQLVRAAFGSGRGRNPALVASLRRKLNLLTKQTVTAQQGYQKWKKDTYDPYVSQYAKFDKLDKSNTSLDAVLGKLTPYDPEAAAERLAAQQALNQALINNKQGRDQLAQDFATGQRQLSTEQPERLRAVLSNFSGRGLANSSGYATAYGNEQSDYAEQLAALQTANQRGQAAYSMADAGAQSDFLSAIAGVLSGTTGRLAANAGTLGMAKNADLPLLLELAKRRLAAGQV